MGKANGSGECAPGGKLRVPTSISQQERWARLKRAFAHQAAQLRASHKDYDKIDVKEVRHGR
jgi:hypothetical protein